MLRRLVGLAVALTGSATAVRAQRLPARGGPMVWATDSAAPCVGLTLTVSADSARVRPLVGPRWIPGVSADGKVPVSVFATRCPRGAIGARHIGAATVAAVIVGVTARGTAGRGGEPAHAAAVPVVYGDSGAPVPELFRAFAFRVRPATVTVDVDSSATPRRIAVRITTAGGAIEASAPVVDTARTTRRESRLVGTDPVRASEFTGPEWSRRSRLTATVRATGRTIFSELGVEGLPTAALYDAGFGWRFLFRMR